MGVHVTDSADLKYLLECSQSILSLGFPEGLEYTSRHTLKCVDIARHHGDEVIADLNFPLVLGKFDLVIDPGTIEHCFNVSQALMNAARAVNLQGHILHNSPLSMLNHGYYNLCPQLYRDFYEANGFSIKKLEFVNIDNRTQRVPATLGRGRVDPEWTLVCIAQRQLEFDTVYPVQQEYRC